MTHCKMLLFILRNYFDDFIMVFCLKHFKFQYFNFSVTILYCIFHFLTNLHLKINKSRKAGSPQKTSKFYRRAPRLYIFQIRSVRQ